MGENALHMSKEKYRLIRQYTMKIMGIQGEEKHGASGTVIGGEDA